MATVVDEEWEAFLNDDGTISEEETELEPVDNENPPKCGDIFISTKTKITYLNIKDIDIAELFWAIPIMSYTKEADGIIKKQIKLTCETSEKYDEAMKKASTVSNIQINRIMRKNKKSIVLSNEETIEQGDSQINKKNKYVCKVSVGMSNKDILSHRIKNKGAFYNCLVLIFRIKYGDEFKEVNVKVFNTGKLSFPGMLLNDLLDTTIRKLNEMLQPFFPDQVVTCNEGEADTVLINSNFNCGYYIDRDKLFKVLRYDYGIHCEYDPCKYPGIRCVYFQNDKYPDAKGICKCVKSCANKRKKVTELESKCRGIAFMIFRTGSTLIVGHCDEDLLNDIYQYLKKILETEYRNVAIGNIVEKREKLAIKKSKKKIIYVKSN
uniref:Uncharacterized protein n=1 Tax=viral metagenome TaxID=1070528 RepID=A0A6C0BVV9_9ZZZZ